LSTNSRPPIFKACSSCKQQIQDFRIKLLSSVASQEKSENLLSAWFKAADRNDFICCCCMKYWQGKGINELHACHVYLNSVMKHNQNDGDCQGCGENPPHQSLEHATQEGVLQPQTCLLLAQWSFQALRPLKFVCPDTSDLLYATIELNCFESLFGVQIDVHCHLDTCSVATLQELGTLLFCLAWNMSHLVTLKPARYACCDAPAYCSGTTGALSSVVLCCSAALLAEALLPVKATSLG